MAYIAGIAANQDELLTAIEAAAVAAGWIIDRSGALGIAGTAGRESLLHKGDAYIAMHSFALIKSYKDFLPALDGPAIVLSAAIGYDAAAAWDAQPDTWPKGTSSSNYAGAYVGPQPYNGSGTEFVNIEWPANYRIFTFTDPDVVICVFEMSEKRYQWLMFGSIVKYGAWNGGHFVSASGCFQRTVGGNYPGYPTFSINDASRVRSFAPGHLMRTDYNSSQNVHTLTNTFIRFETGAGDDNAVLWTYSATTDIYNSANNRRRAVCNPYTTPVNARTPNFFNQVSALSPFLLVTPREDHQAVIGRFAHIRQMPIDNFNPADVFEIGSDRWMVFPYFEKGGVTGRYGWAIRYEGP